MVREPPKKGSFDRYDCMPFGNFSCDRRTPPRRMKDSIPAEDRVVPTRARPRQRRRGEGKYSPATVISVV